MNVKSLQLSEIDPTVILEQVMHERQYKDWPIEELESEKTRYKLGSGPCSVCRWAPDGKGCQGFRGGGELCNYCRHHYTLHE